MNFPTPTEQSDEGASHGTQPARATTPAELGGRLAGLSLPRQVFVLAFWPLLQQFLSFLVGTVDLSLASRLKPTALAIQAADALGVAAYIMWLMGVLLSALGVGAAALIARAIGARRQAPANAAVGQTMLLAVVFGALVGALVGLAAPLIGWAAGLAGEELRLCVVYLRIIAAITPMAALMFEGGACLRAAGDTRTPFWVMVAVNLVNIAASVLLVYGPAPFGGHGMVGIASGTAVAWTVGAVLIVLVLLSGASDIRLRPRRLRPHLPTAWRIIRVGAPNLLESAGGWSGNFLVLIIVSRLPVTGAIGAHMITVRLESVSFLAGYAVSIAASTLTGQYLGAGSPHRARQAVLLCWAVGAGLMACAGALFLAIPGELVSIISTVPLHQRLVPPLLRIAGGIQLFFGTYIIFSGAIRGAGDTTAAMLMTYLSTFVVRLPLAWVLALPLGLGLWGVWLGLCGELVVRAGLFAARFFQGGWARVRV